MVTLDASDSIGIELAPLNQCGSRLVFGRMNDDHILKKRSLWVEEFHKERRPKGGSQKMSNVREMQSHKTSPLLPKETLSALEPSGKTTPPNLSQGSTSNNLEF